MDSEANIGGGGGDKRVGPCGACKFLRRKCVKGCIFAPYFDSDEGTAHFSAVHKVFGASNASKLLLGIPAHERLAAVVTLCYEALARARDPVYGCVAHIFALQQQIANLQAELANVQSRLSTLQAPPLAQLQSSSPTSLYSFSDMASSTDLHSNSGVSTSLEHLQAFPISVELSSFLNISDQHLDNGNLQDLAQELVSRYLAGARFRPANSN